MTELENRAHAQNVLLSSDAIRFFMKRTDAQERNEALDAVVTAAKVNTDAQGWAVLNLPQMEQLMHETSAAAVVAEETTPVTAGSLAEALLMGDVPTAYALCANRPMVALADATADLDAAFRFKKGETVSISEMLKKQSERCSETQLQEAIGALTSALDGTYDTEGAAVKTAVAKAIKALA